MIINDIAKEILFTPPTQGADSLLILTAYATPNMVSWLIKSYQEQNNNKSPVSISLIIGMVPHDGLSVSIHDAFKELHGKPYADIVDDFSCSYVFQGVPVHANLYIWLKEGVPVKAYTGSADFVQNAFIPYRQEIVVPCDTQKAYEFYKKNIKNSIYCNHAEVEEHIVLSHRHEILDAENEPLGTLENDGVISQSLSLLTSRGDIGQRSGLNWGQRDGRNKNEAYIPIPVEIARSGFFPLNKQHFMVRTDDQRTLILRVEQQNDKAITTPLSNAQLGEYFRGRLGVKCGEFITKQDLLDYGRTDVVFYKFDDEHFYMDFSV